MTNICNCFARKPSKAENPTEHAGSSAKDYMMKEWPHFEEKMKKEGLDESAIKAFKGNYEKLCTHDTGTLPEKDIEPVRELPRLSELEGRGRVNITEVLNKTAVVKLNGGLGTSMGLDKAKSLLEVKDGYTFLDLIARQVKAMRKEHNSHVRFLLMNSFSTSEDTRSHLKSHHPELLKDDIEFLQNKAPKVDKETLRPASYPSDPTNEWNPPGHGDLYPALKGSGMLDKLLSEGVEYLFVSNSDNMGATLDLDLLGHFAAEDAPFLMEVCERTASDKKGGHICRRKSDNRLALREQAQTPPADVDSFEDVSTHRFFNTNNLWVNLRHLKGKLEECGGTIPLPLIRNEKNVNPRDKSSPKAYQLETAMGAAIESFNGSQAVVVPRTRFAPVKTCSDLLRLRSDAYSITDSYTVKPEAEQLPHVELDDAHYKQFDKMEALFDGYPSLKECTKLSVTGKVRFSKGITFKNICSIENPSGDDEAVLAPGEYNNVSRTIHPEVPSS